MATVTVPSGPERRRRWASSEKASIVEESLRPGAVVTAVARRHDVHPNLLHHWRRQAKRALEGGQGLKFLPVTMTASVRPKVEGSIEIELAGARVRVDAAVDEAALGRVLRALGR
ncbi:MAG TPA: transposase [Reyranella sp.]|jgi:transposase|nr:transposase [Reyranella sp.]